MSYSTEKAKLIADQLERLATQNLYQLAGQFPNLDFWMAEAQLALSVIDDYPRRFRNLRDAQVSWVKSHGTKVTGYCPVCRGACEFGPTSPEPPRRISSDVMDEARRLVRQAAAHYLVRLCRAGMLPEAELWQYAGRLELPVEPEDLTRSVEDDPTSVF